MRYQHYAKEKAEIGAWALKQASEKALWEAMQISVRPLSPQWNNTTANGGQIVCYGTMDLLLSRM